ncbi:MAG: hypothetical protein WCP55_17365, partial [Lentisphaerota bacterium]
MKNNLWLFALLTASYLTLSADGGTLAYEGFEYPAGYRLNQTVKGNGWSSGWKADATLKQELDATYVADAGVLGESLINMAFARRTLCPCGLQFPRGLAATKLYRGLEKPIDMGKDGLFYFSYLFWMGPMHGKVGAATLQLHGNAEDAILGLRAQDGQMRPCLRVGRNEVNAKKAFPYGTTFFAVIKIRTFADPQADDTLSIAFFGPEDTVPEREEDIVWDTTLAVKGGRECFYTVGWSYQHGLTGDRRGAFDELRYGEN